MEGILKSDELANEKHQGDLQIKAVQVSRPFIYSTSNWRSFECDPDIGHFVNDDEVLYGPIISPANQINEIHGNLNEFSYILKNDLDNRVKIMMHLKSMCTVGYQYPSA